VELQDLGLEYLEQLLSSSGSPSTGTEPEWAINLSIPPRNS
jgi:hypothetical protein